jgi:hypothetical protein
VFYETVLNTQKKKATCDWIQKKKGAALKHAITLTKPIEFFLKNRKIEGKTIDICTRATFFPLVFLSLFFLAVQIQRNRAPSALQMGLATCRHY